GDTPGPYRGLSSIGYCWRIPVSGRSAGLWAGWAPQVGGIRGSGPPERIRQQYQHRNRKPALAVSTRRFAGCLTSTIGLRAPHPFAVPDRVSAKAVRSGPAKTGVCQAARPCQVGFTLSVTCEVGRTACAASELLANEKTAS